MGNLKIAIIGAGNLGISLAEGLLKHNLTSSLILTKRKLGEIEHYSEQAGVTVTSDNSAAVRNSDILIFAVQPLQLKAILAKIKGDLTEKHVLISTITGVSIQEIEAIVGPQKIIRAMPNTAVAVGKSMTCICCNPPAEKKIQMAQQIFDALGKSICIPESQMQAATVICASGIAFWMRLIRATTQGAVQLGFDAKEAQELSMQTCLGAASLLISSGKHPEEEIDKVTTPMGCTIEGLNEMEHQGLSSSLIKGIQASFKKIKPA